MPTACKMLSNGKGGTATFIPSCLLIYLTRLLTGKFIFSNKTNKIATFLYKMPMNLINNGTKYTSDEYYIIMKSIDFIFHHQNSTTREIPDCFLNFWSVKYSGNSNNGQAQILIFTYILKLTLKSSRKTEKILYTPLFFQLFAHFQIIVNTTLYCRKNNIKISPFGIFNIRNYQISTTQQLLKTYSLITQTPFPDATAEKKNS